MPTARLSSLAWGLAAVTVLLEIAYPLIHGHARDVLTVVTVLAFAAATVTHLASSRPALAVVAFVAVTVVVGFTVEAVGTRTGFPFGHYAYDNSLGTRLLRVPLVIPLAWTMMAWPALCCSPSVGEAASTRCLVAGWALASWDLFLDPQMVAAGHWHWRDYFAWPARDPAHQLRRLGGRLRSPHGSSSTASCHQATTANRSPSTSGRTGPACWPTWRSSTARRWP